MARQLMMPRKCNEVPLKKGSGLGVIIVVFRMHRNQKICGGECGWRRGLLHMGGRPLVFRIREFEHPIRRSVVRIGPDGQEAG